MKKLLLALGISAGIGSGLHAADYYWDANGAGGGSGGTGNWFGAGLWENGSGSGTFVNWTDGNNAYLGGTAGTVTVGTTGTTNVSAAGIFATTTGYTIETTSSSRNLSASSLNLSNNVALTLAVGGTGGANFTFGTIQGGTGSSLFLSSAANTNTAGRISLNTAGTINLPTTTINGSGNGLIGFVATATGVNLNGNITNNSSAATMLGAATSGHIFTFGGKISGTAALQLSTETSTQGGAGIIVLSSQNDYTGNTYINNAATGVVRLGISNALTNTTQLYLGQASNDGNNRSGTFDLNGFNQTVAALHGLAGARGVVNTSATTSTLTIDGSASATYASIIGIPSSTTNIAGANNNIAVVKSGSGSQTFSGINTYNAGTIINGGRLIGANNAAFGSGGILVNGGTLALNAGVTIANAITLAGGQYEKIFDLGGQYSSYGSATSSFAGGNPNTTARLVAGTASALTSRTIVTGFANTAPADNDSIRSSDVFSLSGTFDDVFVLQLQATGLTEDSRLGWLNNSNEWVLATANNAGAGALAGFYELSWTEFLDGNPFNAATMLGAYGLDLDTNQVWAVLNHNSQFAIVTIPEPSAAFLLGGAVVALGLARKRKRC